MYEKMVVVEESYDSAASSPKLDCLRAAVPLDVASRHVQKTLGGTLAALTVHYEDDLCAYSYAFQLRGTRLAPSIEMTYILDATTGRFAVIGLPASEMERIVNGPQ